MIKSSYLQLDDFRNKEMIGMVNLNKNLHQSNQPNITFDGTIIKEEQTDPPENYFEKIITEEIIFALKDEKLEEVDEIINKGGLFKDIKIKDEPDEVQYEGKVRDKSLRKLEDILARRNQKKHQFYSCKICSKNFRLKKNYEAHQCRPHLCPVNKCGKSFSRRDNLTQHITYVHVEWKKSELLTCDHCARGFKYKKSLICHMKAHMLTFPLNCKICNEGFSVKNTYRQHMLTHGGKKPCKVCGKRLKPSAHYYHMKQVHDNSLSAIKTKGDLNIQVPMQENKFVCSLCDEKFDQSSSLHQHLLNHQNPSMLSCQICNKKFIHKDLLKQHLFKMHANKKK